MTATLDQSVADPQQIIAELRRQLDERTAERDEALQRETATAEVLGIINSSPGDLAPVFDAMLDKATALCEAAFGVLLTYDGERFAPAGAYGVPPAFAAFRDERGAFPPPPGSSLNRVVDGESVVHIADVTTDAGQAATALVELGGCRTLVCVALRKDNRLIGAITVYRQELRRFTDKQIALLQNFAAQAVIAMENARLITETRERTRDLQESLEYQTATSDVLKVISQSTFDLEPVLQNVLDTAMRLCGNDNGSIFRLEDGAYRLAVHRGLDPAYLEVEQRARIEPGPDTLVGRTVLARRPVHVVDALTDPDYAPKEDAQIGRVRTMLGVPLLREGMPIGVVCMARRTVAPFSDKQIALVNTFADQAVIAIENARLLNELRERTDDLQESLEYQTATSDVLKVISRSTFDLDPVLQTVLDTAVRLCRAGGSEIFRLGDDGAYRWAVGHAQVPEYATIEQQGAIYPGPGTLVGRTAMAGRAVHVLDALADPLYEKKQEAQLGQYRTMLGVPLMREGTVVGVIALSRPVVEAFSEKEIALVTTFADQAVIAIENARLLNELRERTDELARSVEELKVLGEVGQAVSSTLDLHSVLVTILNRSMALADADAGVIFRYSRAERAFRFVDSVGWDEATVQRVRDLSVGETVTALGEVVANRAPLQIADLRTRPPNPLRDSALAAGYRSALIVPLVGADRIMGVTILERRAVGEFPQATIRLMQALATQSVMAIQNARLFREIADKSEQLAQASQHKSQFLANMSHELRTPLNAVIGYSEMLHEMAEDEGQERFLPDLEKIRNAGRHLLQLINDILDLSKIEVGKMDLYLEEVDVTALIEEVRAIVTPLAAAGGNRFEIVGPTTLAMLYTDRTKLKQSLLNLLSNASKFTHEGRIALELSATEAEMSFAVTDSGIGMTEEQLGRLFQAFSQADASTTRRYGGTGLGLAISKHFCELLGGRIDVESAPGRGSTFTITLPVRQVPTAAVKAEPAAIPAAMSAGADAALVMVVDDDPNSRNLLAATVRREGYRVVEAGDGEAAIGLARQHRPDIITLDVLMPRLDGWAVLAALKSDVELRDIPVIIVTVLADRGIALSLGAAEFITKPLDRARLAAVIRENVQGGGTVLAIDDDPESRRLVARHLDKLGWAVVEATDGGDALAWLSRNPAPVLILLDLMMPGMDGFAFLDAIAERGEWQKIPIVILTAKPLDAAERELLAGRVREIIEKGADDLAFALRRVAAHAARAKDPIAAG